MTEDDTMRFTMRNAENHSNISLANHNVNLMTKAKYRYKQVIH